MASSSIVIKVKYGETLRRFSASIADKKIALDIVTLREKIRRLFSFGSNIEFTLTYVDEDGDEVTLVDDYDLHDVFRQSLNPLRITVKLNNGIPCGTNVLLDPPKLHQPHSDRFQNLKSGATSSTPGVANLAEKMQAASLNQISGSMGGSRMQPPTGNVDGQQGVSSESSSLMVTEFLKQTAAYLNQISASSVASQKVHTPISGSSDVNSEPSTVNDSKIPVNPEAESSNSNKTEKQVQKVIEGLKLKDVQPLKSVDLNVPCYEYESLQDPVNSTKSVVEGPTGENTNTGADCVEKKGTNDSGSSPGWADGMLSAENLSSIVGVQTPNASVCDGHHHPSCSSRRDVSCDCCGFYPITGHWRLSRVKENYELRSTCFRGTGTDYIRMDCHQTPNQTLLESLKVPESKLDSVFLLDVTIPDGTIMAPFTRFTKVWRMWNNGSVIWPQGLQLHWVWGDRLGSSLSVDVKIPVDGLPVDKVLDIAVDFMAPGVPGQYASCWSMASPSGQKFGQQVWVNIEIDAFRKDLGLTSLNLNLPPSPTVKNPEVVNHNHLMDSGNNLIKVSDPEAASADSDPKDQEAGFPNDSVINDVDNVSSTMATRSSAEVAAMSSFSDSTEAETASTSLPVGPMVSSGLRPKSISSPTKDFSLLSSALVRGLPPPPTRAPVVQPLESTSQKVSVPSDAFPRKRSARRDEEEQELLKYLEKMGFKKLDLNRKIVRMNSNDLEKSIDDLCCALEWEPMLENLQEMGFVDEETNRRLMEKNYGSITRTVMDLISEETA